MLFADTPALFEAELNRYQIGDMPIPAMPPGPETDVLPIPTEPPPDEA